MVEFSWWTRALAALVVVLASLAARRLLPSASSHSLSHSPSSATTKKQPTNKKKTKKKNKQKTTSTSESNALVTTVEKAASEEDVDASESESEDEHAGRSARQVLARRRFKPTALGGAKPVETTSGDRFREGQRVVARFWNNPDWFPGVVLEVRRGNEYHIMYDDGVVEHHVPYARIKDEAAAKAENEQKMTTRASELPRVEDSGRSEADDEADESVSSSEGDDGALESEDGWQVVDKKRKAAGGAVAAAAAAPVEKVDADGLTKRQRENRRKKERKKEVKEMVRAQAQEHGLHARWGGTMTKMKYVPPPSQP